MGLFNRKKSGAAKAKDEVPGESRAQRFLRRPANTAFKQQRLKAWQPILTPKTVLPTFFLIGILFAPIGGLLLWGSSRVSEFTLDYSQCQNQAGANLANMPSDQYSYSMASGGSGPSAGPQWSFTNSSDGTAICTLQFQVPSTIGHPVFMYYKLTNYYQNHRRYVKSYNSDQLKGSAVSYSSVQGSQCQPLDVLGSKIIYPCGLIANSVFNDTFSNLTVVGAAAGSAATYEMSQKGIVWSGEPDKYQPTQYNPDQIVPPPFWAKRYPNGYTADNLPDLHNDEHFQNWMRTAGLPTFRKLYMRNDNNDLAAGVYSMQINLNYPVLQFGGTKSVVFSNTSWIGGKNPFLGWAYVATAALCLLIGVLLTLRHLLKPRRLGDMSFLTWNRAGASDTIQGAGR